MEKKNTQFINVYIEKSIKIKRIKEKNRNHIDLKKT